MIDVSLGLPPVARRAADRMLRLSPAQGYYRLTAARHLAVLAYHGVDQPDRLAAQLDHLVRNAHPVSLAQVLDSLRSGTELPARSVLITFDDGHRTVLEHGLPLLEERGVPAVAFVTPGLLDSDRPFWWVEVAHLVAAGGEVGGEPVRTAAQWVAHLKTVPDARRHELIGALRASAASPCPSTPQLRSAELVELERAGISVGNHTATHPCLDKCDDSTLVDELARAHVALTAALGKPPVSFAYPNGNWDARAERWLRDAGYRAGFLFDHALSRPFSADPLRISRLRVGTETSPDRFATILSGLHPALHRARGGR